MPYCISCGHPLNVGAKFCPNCGSKQDASPSQQQQSSFPVETKEVFNNFSNEISGNTGLIQRAKNIIIKPLQEWQVVDTEHPVTSKLMFGYAFVLVLIPAVCSFIVTGIIGKTYGAYTIRSIPSGLSSALLLLILNLVGAYLLARVFDLFANSFDSEKNFGKSLQLSVYAYTPAWIAGIFMLISPLSWLYYVLSIYSIVLLYIGMPVIKKTPKSKVIGYLIVSIVALVIVYVVVALIVGLILGFIFAGSIGGLRGY